MAGWYRLALGTLCVWRVTHLLHGEDGPWDIVVRLRRAAGDGMAGRMLDCFYCLSIWVAMPAHRLEPDFDAPVAVAIRLVSTDRHSSLAIPRDADRRRRRRAAV